MTYDNSGNFDLSLSNPSFIHYLFNLLSNHIFALTMWQHNSRQLLSLGLVWPQCLIQPPSVAFQPLFSSLKPPSSAVAGWPQDATHRPFIICNVFQLSTKSGFETHVYYHPSPILYDSITTCLLVRTSFLISEMWMSRGEGKPYLSILTSPLGPSFQPSKTSSIETIRHKALWESLENISHWRICSPGSPGTREKLYIVMAFIEPNSVLSLEESIIYG